MPRIPVYQQQTAATGGAAASPAAARAPAFSNDAAQGTAALAQGTSDLAGGLLAQDLQRRREVEDDAAIKAGLQLSQGRAFWLEQVKARADGYDASNEDTPYGSLQTTVLSDFDKWQADEVQKGGTKRSKQFLQQQFGALRATIQNETFVFERQARIDHQVSSLEASRQADITAVYQYPAMRAEVLGQRVAWIDAIQGISSVAKRKLLNAETLEINEAAERGALDRSPQAWYQERFGAPYGGKGGRSGGAGATGEYTASSTFNFPLKINDATRKWIGPVNEAADAEGVDQNVLLAMVFQESKGHHSAVSHKGARGLLQLMPDTARGLKVDPDDPGQNIKGGARYLAEQLRAFDGDYAKALGAYNGGPARLRGAIERAKVSGGSWQDYMPGETRDYVATILGNVRPPAEPTTAGAAPAAEAAAAARTAEPRDGPASWLAMPYEKREQLRAHAETVIDQRRLASVAGLKDRVENAQAMARVGVADPVPIDPAVFEAAGPDGARLGRQYAQSQKVAGQVSSLEQLPTPEIAAVMKGSAPRAGEDFREGQQDHRAVVTAAMAVMQRRNEDPAGSVLLYHTPAKAAWDAVVASQQGNQEAQRAASSAYAEVMAAEQKRLQLPNAGAIVPQPYADQIVKLFTDSVPSGKVAEQVVALERQWGRHFPRILAQVSKDLPAAAVVIPDIDSPAVREQVARTAAMKLSDLKQGMDPKDLTAGESAIAKDSTMQAFRLSLDPTGNGAQVFSKYNEVIERLAIANQRAGMKPVDAARDAIDRVIGDKYEFRGDASRPYMVPKAQQPDLVDKGTKEVLDQLGTLSLLLPTDRLGAGSAGELPPAELKRRYVQAIKDKAVWVRTPDDDGLLLYAQGFDGRLRQVSLSSGAPVKFTWQGLRMAAIDNDPMQRSVAGRIGGAAFYRAPLPVEQDDGYRAP